MNELASNTCLWAIHVQSGEVLFSLDGPLVACRLHTTAASSGTPRPRGTFGWASRPSKSFHMPWSTRSSTHNAPIMRPTTRLRLPWTVGCTASGGSTGSTLLTLTICAQIWFHPDTIQHRSYHYSPQILSTPQLICVDHCPNTNCSLGDLPRCVPTSHCTQRLACSIDKTSSGHELQAGSCMLGSALATVCDTSQCPSPPPPPRNRA